MGSESFQFESNSSKSDSHSSNSGNNNGKLEEMICLKSNENKIINRVWIVKKAISLKNEHIAILDFFPFIGNCCRGIVGEGYESNPFAMINHFEPTFKHWAIILELSNDSYVNIQFGRNGFSLKEFNKTIIEGENILNAIMETWGQKGHPFSFCFLGNANFRYEELKNKLFEKKNEEKKNFEKEGKTYYNLLHNNCQHFACEVEKILFGKIKIWHAFDYYIYDFFENFFPNIDINTFKN
jgi:hypothetical protein